MIQIFEPDGAPQRFTYTVTAGDVIAGSSEIAIAFPSFQMETADWVGDVVCVNTLYNYGCTIKNKTQAGFTLSLTYTAIAGDTFDIKVANKTA